MNVSILAYCCWCWWWQCSQGSQNIKMPAEYTALCATKSYMNVSPYCLITPGHLTASTPVSGHLLYALSLKFSPSCHHALSYSLATFWWVECVLNYVPTLVFHQIGPSLLNQLGLHWHWHLSSVQGSSKVNTHIKRQEAGLFLFFIFLKNCTCN